MTYQMSDYEVACKIKRLGSNATWKTSGGKFIKVKFMKSEHIINLIEVIKRKEDYTFNVKWKAWVTVLNKELIKRREGWKR